MKKWQVQILRLVPKQVWTVLSHRMALPIAFFFLTQVTTTFPQRNLKPRGNTPSETRLKSELGALKKVVLEKVDADTTSTADAFAEGEDIFRSLRIAYSFKTALDTVANTLSIFGLPGDIADIGKAKSMTEAATNSALAAGSVLLIWESMKEDSGKLALTFNSRRYVDNVRNMLKDAGSTQPIIGFDKTRYRDGIKFQLGSSRGQELIDVHHIRPKDPCRAIEPKAPLTVNPPRFNGIIETTHHLLSIFTALDLAIDQGVISDSQAEELISLIHTIKTGLLKSRLGTSDFNLSLKASSECSPRNTRIIVGRIAERQQILNLAYGALYKKLRIEQVGTVKTAGDAMLSAVTTYLKDGNQIKEVLKAEGKVSLSIDLGDLINKRFETQSDPGELISELPQEMLMAMPQELAETVHAIDFLDLSVRHYLTPIPPSSPSAPSIPTLFLFDVSGSMAENDKIGQARAAGLDALKEMRDAGAGRAPVSVMTFSGDQCGGDVTRTLQGFVPGTAGAESVIRNRVGPPNGGTPLPQARDAAVARMTDYLRSNAGVTSGRIILLSDGQSTCGEIRPPGVFSRRDIRVGRAANSPVQFFTIGFDVPAGSVAERDLQYLASSTGGRYYNAADREQLISSFRKQVRIYMPRACNTADSDATAGLKALAASDFASAAESYRRFSSANPNEPCGLYNLALAYEAGDRYKKAAENYRRYLSAATSSSDRAKVEVKIAEMYREYAAQFDYFLRLIESDKDYLDRYYSSIFNRNSADLAAEFGGFVYEKGEFYARLPEILEIDDPWLRNDARDISASIGVLEKRRSLASFDRDAVSLLTTPIGQIEDMLERLRKYRSTNIH